MQRAAHAVMAVAAIFIAGLAAPAAVSVPGAADRAVAARELAARVPSGSRGLPVAGASTWTAIKAPLPFASLGTILWQMACHSAAMCVAAGDYGDLAGEHLLLLTGHGSSWTAIKAPLPAGAASSSGGYIPTVNSVACLSASACVAAGYYHDSSGRSYGLLLTGHGSSWTATQAPLPAGAAASPGAILSDVTCPSATECVAVGSYSDSAGDVQGLLVTGQRSSWTATQAPLPGGATRSFASLSDVACPSATICAATGEYFDSAARQEQGLLLTGHGSSWTAVKAPLPPGATGVTLGDVACPSAATCAAMGGYLDSAGHQQGLLLAGHGSSWTATRMPRPADAAANPLATLYKVACPSAATCTATGEYTNSSGKQQLLMLAGHGSSWTATKAPLPAMAVAATSSTGPFFSGLACPSTATCVATGAYIDPAGNEQGLLFTRHGPAWTLIKTPLPVGGVARYGNGLGSVACPSARCAIAGFYYDSSAEQGLLLTGPG
jgi:hypothetical protein